jgi:hypothetical protein
VSRAADIRRSRDSRDNRDSRLRIPVHINRMTDSGREDSGWREKARWAGRRPAKEEAKAGLEFVGF